ncbi:hypothetical protein OSB04_005945 [Centaurea solstitialis]|uniref:Protein FAR1-RELATED SEQUENCE n=1 Tax=Centaurea solstitialis TaxID=347529 RepID=A0AA38TTN5_9ASTR|nr:hypothetical protein OSB04_005945 [Centaurea solstitialis]
MEDDFASSDVQIIEEFINEFADDDDDSEEITFDDQLYKQTRQHDLQSTGTKYWVPNPSGEVRISVGDEFPTIDEADAAYRRYADVVGREGIPAPKEYDTLNLRPGQHKVRNSSVKRTGCKACIKFRRRKADARYVVYKFEERHNHRLYNVHDKRFARSRRQLKYTDYRNIYNASSSSFGGSKSHTIQSALKGGVEYVGASELDYKNARRDMILHVGKKDAHMLVSVFTKRKKAVPDFFFEYKIEKNELQALFWVDEISKMNYKEFGDTVSFDATYRTNRHAMNFIPFIAIDNHKRSVVVGSALISHENTPNFTWVLQAFVRAHNSQPRFVITDQCLGMKEAIPEVLTESKHRLCAWHIMKKIPQEVKTLDATNYEAFKKRIKRIVWSTHIEPAEFEEEWCKIIDDYALHGNDWLADKFSIREAWISAYYKNDPMSGLMRTTSRSESSHAYFRLFASFKNDFVRFLRAFDSAIEKQRNKHSCLEFANRHTYPRCLTPLPIERHASEVYTKTVFNDVQKEIHKALYFCGLHVNSEEGDIVRYVVTHKNRKMVTKVSYQVTHNVVANTFDCQCNLFTRIGILCRHVFKILLNNGDNKIPNAYIVRRWTRALVPVQVQAAKSRYGEIDIEKEASINGLYSDIDVIVSCVRNDKRAFQEVREAVGELKKKYGAVHYFGNTAKDRAEALRECYGVDPPKHPALMPPSGICNKGSGTGKRLKGALEEAFEKSTRAKRLCRLCNKHAHHDSRNCPTRGSDF